jgi:sigma-B regulation protein RsbU (phosphoserine phosphatase)
MGVVHGAIRALSTGKADSNLAGMAERLNELLREGGSAEFVTLFWAFYNPERHTLRYVNAGHPPPLLVGSNSGEPRRLETGGTVLGLLPKMSYQEECIALDGNETLIAYSDGLLEATNPAEEEFGEARLVQVARAAAGESSGDVLRRVMAKANRFIEGGAFQDDLTVLVAKLARKPAEGAHPVDPYWAGAESNSGRSTVMGA